MTRSIGLLRRSYFLTVVIALLVTGAAVVCTRMQGVTWPWKQPDHVVVPGYIDFGNILPSLQAKSVEIYNPTRRTITITRVVSNCGCTVPDIKTPRTVKPGQTIQCKISLDATGLTGQAKKRIVFHTDDLVHTDVGDKDIAHVTNIVAFVERPVRPSIVPSVLTVGRIGTWESVDTIVNVVNRGSVELGVGKLVPAANWIELKAELPSRGAIPIRVLLRPHDEEGDFTVKQIVETSQGQTAFTIQGDRRTGLYLDTEPLVFRERNGASFEKRVIVHHSPDVNCSLLQIIAPTWHVDVGDLRPISTTATEMRVILTEQNTTKAANRGTMRLSLPHSLHASEVQFVVIDKANRDERPSKR